MTLHSFRDEPREEHLDRSRRVASCVDRLKHATIRSRAEEPDSCYVPITPYEWEE